MIKYKFSFLFVFILLLCGFSFVSADNYNLDLLGKVIYIDPGHGGLWKIQILINDYKY